MCIRDRLDSHADTCVVGNNVLVTHVYDRTVTVTGYDPSQEATRGLQVVSAQVAYDKPDTGEVVLLTIHQAIQVPTMEHNLLCPMQLRMNDCTVLECPKFLITNPNEFNHSITARSVGNNIITIPLRIKGVTSYFPCRKPTQEDLRCAIDEYELTGHLPEWDPHSRDYEEQEDALLDNQGRLIERIEGPIGRTFAACHSDASYMKHSGATTKEELSSASIRSIGDKYSQTSSVLSEVSNTLNDDTFHQALVDNVCVSSAATGKKEK